MRLRKALIARGADTLLHVEAKGGLYISGLMFLGHKRVGLENPSGEGTREEWNVRVEQIKTAVKGILKQEVGWK